MEEAVAIARKVAGRIGNELNIPVYCYENAAFEAKRRNLANCRAGEYEGLREKLVDPAWKPDYGPAGFNEKAGATIVGAREFLVAFNINLNTTSARLANDIASDVREKGRNIINDKGVKVNIPGTLKHVKALGWYMDEYGVAQVSMNLTNLSVTPVHVAFEEVCGKAAARGVRVTGSELVGLIPLGSMLDAGRYFMEKQGLSSGVADDELVRVAVKTMGMNDTRCFYPDEKIIELVMTGKNRKRLAGISIKEYLEVTASGTPAPGGGSAASCMGALGVALGTMVANLSARKKGWDDTRKLFLDWAAKGQELQAKLLVLVDEDTMAYNELIKAYSLPSGSGAEKMVRRETIQAAIRKATLVPLDVMSAALDGYRIIREMVIKGNPTSVTDAAVGALAIRSCIKGAFMNIKVNAIGLTDKTFADDIVRRAGFIDAESAKEEKEILFLAESVINGLPKR
jgi:glutamate formiminotransferase/formiminotetrahydrofolate cyclodeaminase